MTCQHKIEPADFGRKFINNKHWVEDGFTTILHFLISIKVFFIRGQGPGQEFPMKMLNSSQFCQGIIENSRLKSNVLIRELKRPRHENDMTYYNDMT